MADVKGENPQIVLRWDDLGVRLCNTGGGMVGCTVNIVNNT